MSKNCKKCGKETGPYDLFLCYSCQRKEDRQGMFIMGGIVAVIFLVIFGIRLLWAKFIYNDYRCVIGECRILK